MKKINLPCQFSGKEQDVHFYVGNPKPENHPIQNQAHWLSSERGGVINAKVMQSFERIHKMSQENNVPFSELCEYTIKLSDSNQDEEDSQYNELTEAKDSILEKQQESLSEAEKTDSEEQESIAAKETNEKDSLTAENIEAKNSKTEAVGEENIAVEKTSEAEVSLSKEQSNNNQSDND